MKTHRLAVSLAGGLLVSSICTFLLCGWYIYTARQGLRAQAQVARLNFMETAMRALVLESAEYSKRNPAILPLLQSLNVISTNLPAPRPSTK